MSQQVEAHYLILYEAVAGEGGVVFSSMGDGVAAAFTTAEQAIDAAIAAQRAILRTALRARMGVHVGPAEFLGHDYRGRAVNRAARVMAAGHGGQIVVSDATASLLRNARNSYELVDLGLYRLRDLGESEYLWQVAHPDLPTAFPPLRGVDSNTTNLPTFRSSFVGRENELAVVAGRVRSNRVVTLTGSGGVGKTRLATHVCAELLADLGPVWFVDLASAMDRDSVDSSVAVAIGVTSAGGSSFSAVADAIGDHHGLVLLDNCEHVLDAAAALVDELTIACPELRILATSREPLSVEGEHVIALRSLDPAGSAAELFRQRAAAAGAALDDNEQELIETICRRLDGIPLAIELAQHSDCSRSEMDSTIDLYFCRAGGDGLWNAIKLYALRSIGLIVYCLPVNSVCFGCWVFFLEALSSTRYTTYTRCSTETTFSPEPTRTWRNFSLDSLTGTWSWPSRLRTAFDTDCSKHCERLRLRSSTRTVKPK
jgi:hypothetical protein